MKKTANKSCAGCGCVVNALINVDGSNSHLDVCSIGKRRGRQVRRDRQHRTCRFKQIGEIK